MLSVMREPPRSESMQQGNTEPGTSGFAYAFVCYIHFILGGVDEVRGIRHSRRRRFFFSWDLSMSKNWLGKSGKDEGYGVSGHGINEEGRITKISVAWQWEPEAALGFTLALVEAETRDSSFSACAVPTHECWPDMSVELEMWPVQAGICCCRLLLRMF